VEAKAEGKTVKLRYTFWEYLCCLFSKGLIPREGAIHGKYYDNIYSSVLDPMFGPIQSVFKKDGNPMPHYGCMEHGYLLAELLYKDCRLNNEASIKEAIVWAIMEFAGLVGKADPRA